MRPAIAFVALVFASCHGGLSNGVFVKDGRAYAIGDPPASWKRVDIEDNDLAFVNGDHSIAVNSTCKDHGDPPLNVLTQHLLIGFTDRERVEEDSLTLDGREALRSHWKAKLDGVPVEMLFVVMKKDGCVYDFSYVAPPGAFDEDRKVFDAMLARFKTQPPS